MMPDRQGRSSRRPWLTLKTAGYPAKADMAKVDKLMVIAILTYLVILVTMVYGPIRRHAGEMFPTRIRYTSMSHCPYHIGNGWFGGLLPTTAFAIVAQTGNMYNGLWYPIIIAAMTLVIGTLFVMKPRTGCTPRTDIPWIAALPAFAYLTVPRRDHRQVLVDWTQIQR